MIWLPKENEICGCEGVLGKECLITLEPRPHYCDRGNWIAKLFPTGILLRDIDEADGWPRYYFDKERAKAEIEAWLTKRKQVIKNETVRSR